MHESIAVGVVGAGHMGRIHARKYRELGVDWIGIVDQHPGRAKALAELVGGHAVELSELGKRATAVSVCVPPQSHHDVALSLIGAQCDVLVEKPIADTIEAARSLADYARRESRLLQVAHQERFNPAVVAATEYIKRPKFVEIHRLGMPSARSGPIDVIRDVMIHDLDILLSWIDAEVIQIDAVGTRVLTEHLDIANARLRFDNGCVANLTVSRVTPKSVRKIRVFDDSGYLSLDCESQTTSRVYRVDGQIRAETIDVERVDVVEVQLASFLRSVADRAVPSVTAEQGIRALELAIRIQQSISEHAEWTGTL